MGQQRTVRHNLVSGAKIRTNCLAAEQLYAFGGLASFLLSQQLLWERFCGS